CRLRGHRHAGHRRDHRRQPAGRRIRRVLERALAPGAARLHPRLPVARLHRPHDAQLHAGPAAAGIRAGDAGQGSFALARHLGPCAGQCLGAAGHHHRPHFRQPARGRGPDRDGVRLAGPRPLHQEFPVQRRPQCRAGRHGAGGRGLYRAEHALRPDLPAGRSARAGPAVMASAPASGTARAWLLSPAPTSRTQARCGRWFRAWLGFRRNTLAMTGLVIVLLLVLMAVFAPLIADRQSTTLQELGNRLQPASWHHLFGTDELGRDIFARVVFGSRITLTIVALVSVIVVPVGLAIGLPAGYFGGLIDTVLMRITDIFLAFPRLVLALAFAAALGPGIENAVIAISLTAWPPYARLARAETLTR